MDSLWEDWERSSPFILTLPTSVTAVTAPPSVHRVPNVTERRHSFPWHPARNIHVTDTYCMFEWPEASKTNHRSQQMFSFHVLPWCNLIEILWNHSSALSVCVAYACFIQLIKILMGQMSFIIIISPCMVTVVIRDARYLIFADIRTHFGQLAMPIYAHIFPLNCAENNKSLM